MAPRANWKGFLRLSLVTCPVALYPATSDSEKISFNQINKNTGHRIKYTRVDTETGEEVPNEDIVKGFKVDTDTYVEVTKEELDNVALESTRTIDIDEFVQREEIDPRYIIRPYYLRPDGKVGHDAFAVIRETIRDMNMVAIGRVVLTSREHIIALEPLDKGLMGTLLRYPYEVRDEKEYFDEIQDVKVTKDMLDLAKHIVNQKAADFEPKKFEDHYEGALVDLINKKRNGQPLTKRERPAEGNVVNLMDALRRSIGAPEPFKAVEEAAQGRERSEGNADAHRGQESGQGSGCEEGQAATQVSLDFGTLRAGVADRIQHIANRGDRLFRRDAGWRIPTGDEKGALAGMRIGAVHRPAVFLAFANGIGLEQNRPGPSFDRRERGPSFLHHQHRNHSSRLATRTLRTRPLFRTQRRDSQSREIRLFHLFRRIRPAQGYRGYKGVCFSR